MPSILPNTQPLTTICYQIVAQLISFPLMRLWARVVPRVKIFGVQLNPGPFNIKEHTVITIMASAVYSDVYVTTVFATQKAFYNQSISFGYQILLALSTQCLGYSFAGVARRFLVWPASMVWPQNLIVCTLLNTLHAEEEDARGAVTRFKFFCYAAVGSFFWFFLPGTSRSPAGRPGRSCAFLCACMC